MPLGVWNPEFLALNAARNYPLADDATCVDQSGLFTLPNDFIVALDLPVSAGMDVDPSKFYVMVVGAYASGYSLVVGYDSTSGPVAVATAQFPRVAQGVNTTYTLGGLAPFDDTVGKVTVGRFDSIDLQPTGVYNFSPDAGRLDAGAARLQLRGVSGLVLINGGARSARIYGDIELIAGTNIQLVPVLNAGQNPQVIINAVSGEGTVSDCVCEGDAASLPCITRINGVPPTQAGDFTLTGDDCLSFSAVTNGLRLSDGCSAPCCGCSELETITRDLARYKQQQDTLTGVLNQLSASVTQMDQIVLGARLGDQGCTTC